VRAITKTPWIPAARPTDRGVDSVDLERLRSTGWRSSPRPEGARIRQGLAEGTGAARGGPPRLGQHGHRAARTDHPTPNDLGVLYGGRNRLLTVSEVAEQRGVCTAIVYRLCESGELPHVRVVEWIRVRPVDLAAFLA
jgi:excisionase family DNA binding protein